MGAEPGLTTSSIDGGHVTDLEDDLMKFRRQNSAVIDREASALENIWLGLGRRVHPEIFLGAEEVQTVSPFGAIVVSERAPLSPLLLSSP
jgi:hypothetical protein